MSGTADTIDARFHGTVGDFHLDVAFTAPITGVTALFGASGSGKTTVLRCIAGLHRMAGRLSVAGDVWQDDAAGAFRRTHQRPIGYVFQEASLFPHLSVRDNLAYGRKRTLRAGAAGAITEADVAAFLRLAPLLDRAPSNLSGGERQRVAVGRALLSQPKLLLMDEPLAALDQNSKAEILPYFERLRDELAIPILYVSHAIGEVARLADAMVLMAHGKIVASGSVGDILTRLDLGDAIDRNDAGTVIHARVVAHDPETGVTRLAHPAGDLFHPLLPGAIGTEARLRVRARDIALAVGDPGLVSIRNRLSCTVTEIAERGAGAVDVRLAAGSEGLVARITRDAVAALNLAVGTKVVALIKATAFDRTDALTEG